MVSHSKATRCRNWMITINYVSTEVYQDEYLTKCLLEFPDTRYFIFQLERAKTGTLHHHILCCFSNAKSFEVMAKKFPRAHLEPINGSVEETRIYCSKEVGRVRGPIEYGNLPQQGKRTDLDVIYEMLKDGANDADIREKFPSTYIRYSRQLKSIRQEILEEQYENGKRDVEVTYIFGDPGTGKTSYVLDRHGYANVYRITDYIHPFDQYQGQDVIVFEEFRSSLRVQEMLNYLDIYPFRLPARYENRVACYTKIYIITNIGLEEQYEGVQQEQALTYQALLRRINKGVMHFIKNPQTGFTNTIHYSSVIDYLRQSKKEKTGKNHNLLRLARRDGRDWFDKGMSDDEYTRFYSSTPSANNVPKTSIEQLLK